MFDKFEDFYDACAHQSCMQSWARRDEFIAYFNWLVDDSNLDGGQKLCILNNGKVVYERDRSSEA